MTVTLRPQMLLESGLDPQREGSAQIILLVDDQNVARLGFPEIFVGQVTSFEFNLKFLTSNGYGLSCNKIQLQTRTLDKIGVNLTTGYRAACRHPIARIAQKKRILRQPFGILYSKLNVGQMLRLSSQRPTVDKHLIGRTDAQRIIQNRGVIGADFQLRFGIGIVRNGDKPVVCEEIRISQTFEREIFQQFDLSPVKLCFWRIGKSGLKAGTAARNEGDRFDRIVDLLVEPGHHHRNNIPCGLPH